MESIFIIGGTVGGIITWYFSCGKQYGDSSTEKIEKQNYHVIQKIPLLGIDLKEM